MARAQQVAASSETPDPHQLALVVEPNVVEAAMYRVSLMLRGFAVEVVQFGDEGIQRVLQGEHPAVIVLDLGMPGPDEEESAGAWTPDTDERQTISTFRRMRWTSSVPIIVISDDPRTEEDAIDRGATDCITKSGTTPAGRARMVGLLAHWLSQR